MLNKLTNDLWIGGLVLGLCIGGLLTLMLHYGWHTELGIDKPIRWLASCPPLSWSWVMDLAREIQLGILVIWWAGVGAALGWLIDGGKADKATALLLAFSIISAHELSYNNLGLAVERQIKHFQLEMDKLF